MPGRTLMVMGTGSGVGKSLLTAALCRIFTQEGLSVAPYKSQNMSYIAHVCAEGGEISRALALQAAACRLDPTV
ncbi:MAG: cobyric acid synthase, partial [Planctomycetota bacterium]